MAEQRSKLSDPQYISEEGVLALANISPSDEDVIQISPIDALPINVHRMVCKALNYFLDYVLFAALNSAGNLDVQRVRTTFAQLVPSGLNDVAYTQARQDLERYSGQKSIPDFLYSNSFEIDPNQLGTVFGVLRVKCMTFSTLGKIRENDFSLVKQETDREILSALTPFLTVYATTVLESIGDYLVMRAARIARKRVGKRRATETYPNGNVLLTLEDLEYAAETSPLALMWNSWKANYWRKHYVDVNSSVLNDKDAGFHSKSSKHRQASHNRKIQNKRQVRKRSYARNQNQENTSRTAQRNETSDESALRSIDLFSTDKSSKFLDFETNIQSNIQGMRNSIENLLERVSENVRHLTYVVSQSQSEQATHAHNPSQTTPKQPAQYQHHPQHRQHHQHHQRYECPEDLDTSEQNIIRKTRNIQNPCENVKYSGCSGRQEPDTRHLAEDRELAGRIQRMVRSHSSGELNTCRNRQQQQQQQMIRAGSSSQLQNTMRDRRPSDSRARYSTRRPSACSQQHHQVCTTGDVKQDRRETFDSDGNRQVIETYQQTEFCDPRPTRERSPELVEETTSQRRIIREPSGYGLTQEPSFRVTEDHSTYRHSSQQQRAGNAQSASALNGPLLPSQQTPTSKQARKQQKKTLKKERRMQKKEVKRQQKQRKRQIKQRQKLQKRQLKEEQRDREREVLARQKEQKRQLKDEQLQREREIRARQREQKRIAHQRQKEQRKEIERHQKIQRRNVKQQQQVQKREVKQRQREQARVQTGQRGGFFSRLFGRS